MAEDLSGQQIAGFRLQERIGRGGMSTVYRARQPVVGRDVAVKVIEGRLARQASYRQRFNREARVHAALQHPHVLPILDAGEDAGRAYIVMAYMPGGALSWRIHGKVLPVPAAVRITAQIASAVDAAHAQGIVHADIKPGNILLDAHDNAYLTDFGIARVEGDPPVTRVPGTYAYVAPEVALGGVAGPLVDIYALGGVVYEMLTGDIPFPIDDSDSMVQVHRQAPIPDLQRARPDLPPGMALALRQALNPDPRARTPTAAAFARALAASAKGAAEQDVPPVPPRIRLAPAAPARGPAPG
ncbi:MAG: serine/threonine protein kinase, partial [Chloroflexi bacterium]|nr:serine/threonine protein kinase [Chloroflexota bacterium]